MFSTWSSKDTKRNRTIVLNSKCFFFFIVLFCLFAEFAEIQKKSQFERAEWVRKQGMQMPNELHFKTIFTPLNSLQTTFLFSHTGPHFVEYLSFEVTPECDVYLKCKVRLGF